MQSHLAHCFQVKDVRAFLESARQRKQGDGEALVLGMDAEWRPRELLSDDEESRVCLLQISDGEKAVIIDFVNLFSERFEQERSAGKERVSVEHML